MSGQLADTINNFISTCNTLSSSKNREIEIRYGRSRDNRYIPALSLYQWQAVKEWATTRSINGKGKPPIYIKIEDEVSYYSIDRNTDIRVIETKNTELSPNPVAAQIFKIPPKISYQKKTRILLGGQPSLDSINFGLRMSLSLEDLASKDDIYRETPKFTRARERYSFLFNSKKQRLDLTIVKTKEGTSYEAELEILDSSDPKLINLVEIMLGVIQSTPIYYNYQLRDSLFLKVNKLIGSENGEAILAIDDLVQPRNLKWEDLRWGGLVGASKYSNPNSLPSAKTEYVMMHKADGLRRLMFIDSTGIWLFHPPFIASLIYSRILEPTTDGQRGMQIFLNKYNGTLIDGEVIPLSNQKVVRKFETMFVAIDLISLAPSKEPNGTSSRSETINKEIYWAQNYTDRMVQLLNFSNELGDTLKQLAEGEALSLAFICPPFLPTVTGNIVTAERYGDYGKKAGRLSNNWPPAVDFFENIIELQLMLDIPGKIQYATDGFIFYPISIPYRPFSPGLFLRERVLSYAPDVIKWKSLSQLTIDLEVRSSSAISGQRTGNKKVYMRNKYVDFEDEKDHVFDVRNFSRQGFIGDGFYEVRKDQNELIISSPRFNAKRATDIVQATNAWTRNERFVVQIVTRRVPTPYSKERRPPVKDLRILVHGGKIVPFEGTFSIPFEGKIDWSNFADVENGQIVEFQINNKILIPVKLRPEKPYPNEFEIVEEIWNLVHDPITLETLEGFDFKFQDRYHSFLKQKIINNLPKRTRICIIGGQDVNKLRLVDFNEVVVVENNAEIAKQINNPLVKVVNFSDLRTFKVASFDAVIFLDTIDVYSPPELRDILGLVDNVLVHNGYLCIFYLDGDSVEEILNPAFSSAYRNGTKKENNKEQTTYSTKFNDLTLTLKQDKVTVHIPAISSTSEKSETRYLFSFSSLQKGLSGYVNTFFEKAGGELFLPSYQYQFSRLYSTIIMQKARSVYAGRALSLAGKPTALGSRKKKKGSENETGNNGSENISGPEISEGENIVVLDDTPLGEIRLVMDGIFFDLLLNAFSPTYSRIDSPEAQTQFRTDYREKLADYLDKNKGDDKYSKFTEKEITTMITALRKLWPFRPVGFKGKNIINEISQYNLLSRVIDLNIFLFRYDEDSLVPIIDSPQIKENKSIALAQREDRFYLIGELDEKNEMYRTVFDTSNPLSPVEESLANLRKAK